MSNEKLIEDLYTTTFSNNEAFFKRAADALAQADKDIESLRKNDKRYRWLRDGKISGYKLHQTISDDCNPPYQEFKHGHELDAAIDAATPEGETK